MIPAPWMAKRHHIWKRQSRTMGNIRIKPCQTFLLKVRTSDNHIHSIRKYISWPKFNNKKFSYHVIACFCRACAALFRVSGVYGQPLAGRRAPGRSIGGGERRSGRWTSIQRSFSIRSRCAVESKEVRAAAEENERWIWHMAWQRGEPAICYTKCISIWWLVVLNMWNLTY